MGPPGVGPRRRPSGIPRSRGSSREPSPSRSYGLRYNLRTTPPVAPPSVRPHLTENILKQSREAESALADALVSLFFLVKGIGLFPSKMQFYVCLFISFLIFSFFFNLKAYFNHNIMGCLGFSLHFLVFFCFVYSCSFLFILVLGSYHRERPLDEPITYGFD